MVLIPTRPSYEGFIFSSFVWKKKRSKRIKQKRPELMGRQTVFGNHKMELTTFKHHFILIDSQKLSASKDPFVRNVLFFLSRKPILNYQSKNSSR